jgi:hypothetical protein
MAGLKTVVSGQWLVISNQNLTALGEGNKGIRNQNVDSRARRARGFQDCRHWPLTPDH